MQSLSATEFELEEGKSSAVHSTSRTGGFDEDLSAPLGFGLISGAEDEEDAEPRSALLRTAGPQ